MELKKMPNHESEKSLSALGVEKVQQALGKVWKWWEGDNQSKEEMYNDDDIRAYLDEHRHEPFCLRRLEQIDSGTALTDAQRNWITSAMSFQKWSREQ
jgi:hypothetical protein